MTRQKLKIGDRQSLGKNWGVGRGEPPCPISKVVDVEESADWARSGHLQHQWEQTQSRVVPRATEARAELHFAERCSTK